MLSFGEACALARRRGTRLLAVDGLPCSGKSTLAGEIVETAGFQCIAVDDFFLPLSAWPHDIRPSFPSAFYRYGEFLAAVKELAESGRCSYFPFDWGSMNVSQESRLVRLADGPVLVEGTSSLHPDIAPLFDLRFFVESDETTILEAVLERDGNYFEKEWRNLWLPSLALYMETKPRERTDFFVAGRGVR